MARRRASHGPLTSSSDDAFGAFAEAIAKFLGTPRYLFWQSVAVVAWVVVNVCATAWRWDPYPFILLNLFFSTQASYAAPLILLAQNRQDVRDRAKVELDIALDTKQVELLEQIVRKLNR